MYLNKSKFSGSWSLILLVSWTNTAFPHAARDPWTTHLRWALHELTLQRKNCAHQTYWESTVTTGFHTACRFLLLKRWHGVLADLRLMLTLKMLQQWMVSRPSAHTLQKDATLAHWTFWRLSLEMLQGHVSRIKTFVTIIPSSSDDGFIKVSLHFQAQWYLMAHEQNVFVTPMEHPTTIEPRKWVAWSWKADGIKPLVQKPLSDRFVCGISSFVFCPNLLVNTSVASFFLLWHEVGFVHSFAVRRCRQSNKIIIKSQCLLRPHTAVTQSAGTHTFGLCDSTSALTR